MLNVKANAEQTQKDLLNKGYAALKSCDVEEAPTGDVMHYSLEKQLGKEMEPPCIFDDEILLDSMEALDLITKFLNEDGVKIHPASAFIS
jgi:hypothetical protein